MKRLKFISRRQTLLSALPGYLPERSLYFLHTVSASRFWLPTLVHSGKRSWKAGRGLSSDRRTQWTSSGQSGSISPAVSTGNLTAAEATFGEYTAECHSWGTVGRKTMSVYTGLRDNVDAGNAFNQESTS